MKICSKCKQEKPLDQFYPNKKRKDGYNVWCKNCNLIYNSQFKDPERRKKWREKNKEYNKKIHKEYYNNNKEKLNKQSREYLQTSHGKYLTYKNGAKRRNIDFELSEQEFNTFWNKSCYYCKDEIATIGVDRIDSSKGYNLNNCVPCCNECNQIKMDLDNKTFIEKITKIYLNYVLPRN
jgi:hypothetical protein